MKFLVLPGPQFCLQPSLALLWGAGWWAARPWKLQRLVARCRGFHGPQCQVSGRNTSHEIEDLADSRTFNSFISWFQGVLDLSAALVNRMIL